MNNFSAVGRIGRDAVTRFTQAGKAVTGWSLAVDTGFGDSKKTTWLECNLWGDRGSKLAEHIRKGDRLGVLGEIGTREHEGKIFVTLNVKDVTLLGEKKEGQKNGGQQQRHPAQRATENAPEDEFSDDIPF